MLSRSFHNLYHCLSNKFLLSLSLVEAYALISGLHKYASPSSPAFTPSHPLEFLAFKARPVHEVECTESIMQTYPTVYLAVAALLVVVAAAQGGTKQEVRRRAAVVKGPGCPTPHTAQQHVGPICA